LEDENAKLRSLHGLSVNATRPKAAGGAAGAASQPTEAGDLYLVRRGDSWERIAGKFGTQPATLASLNGMKVATMIHPGQKLKVPGSPRAVAVASAPAPKPQPAASTPTTGRTHEVKQGETFYSIGMKYGVSTASLMEANPTIKPSAMRPGQILHLAGSSATAPAKMAAAPASKPTSATAPPSLGTTSRTTAPVSTHGPSAPSKPVSTAAASPSTPAKMRIKSVMIDGKTTFGEFATRHGTDVRRLNDLNALDLVDTTVLAKGSELYVPAQP
jgi:LysM repeat protein